MSEIDVPALCEKLRQRCPIIRGCESRGGSLCISCQAAAALTTLATARTEAERQRDEAQHGRRGLWTHLATLIRMTGGEVNHVPVEELPMRSLMAVERQRQGLQTARQQARDAEAREKDLLAEIAKLSHS